MKKIAGGQEGNVYLLNNKKIIKHRKINTDNKEFRIQHILYNEFPEHIIRPLDQFRTLNGKPIFLMNFLNAKNFKNFPNITRELVCKVLSALDDIHKKFPSFRHNDLHAGNVMVTRDEKVYITDFGKARMDLPGVDHMSIYPDYGIVPNNDQRYDYHFFINSVYFASPPALKKIIDIALPPEYIGKDTSKLQNFRLRPGVDHSKLPSRKKLVKIFCIK